MRKRPTHLGTQPTVSVVELCCVLPAVKVGVAAVGEHAAADAEEVLGLPCDVVLGARDQVLRVLRRPRVVNRHVVGHEVEEEADAALAEFLSKRLERRVAAEVVMHFVLHDGVGRAAHHVLRQLRVRLHDFQRALQAEHAGLPHASQLDNVEPRFCEAVDLRFREVIERGLLSLSKLQLLHDDPGVELEQVRILDKWRKVCSNNAGKQHDECKSS
mmetsp:Transcript_6252/g.12171  ORF Transcript_6252/g.12171 Transcript_6252/m.12171 type:complete len:215 (+) Transcript_6252:426-1070(+)